METLKELYIIVQQTLNTLGQTIGFRDILDILIITYLIYKVLSVMRKTNASSVIKGIILVLVIVGLANILELKVMTFLLDQTLQMGIIVLIVLFQPEIRKLFEQVGSSRVSQIFRKRGDIESIETGIKCVVEAASVMMKSKTGAIIVYERKVGLNDYAVTGIKIDASITAELIENIFYHNTPLHDGALLIREGRLLAAACMLPLSNNITLSRDLGMRHRAGVGISERSDAVAVIISEQTGTISVAVDGMLKRHLAIDTLEILLRNELFLTDSKKRIDKAKTKAMVKK